MLGDAEDAAWDYIDHSPSRAVLLKERKAVSKDMICQPVKVPKETP